MLRPRVVLDLTYFQTIFGFNLIPDPYAPAVPVHLMRSRRARSVPVNIMLTETCSFCASLHILFTHYVKRPARRLLDSYVPQPRPPP